MKLNQRGNRRFCGKSNIHGLRLWDEFAVAEGFGLAWRIDRRLVL
jgi:hypothetical protein